MSKLADILAKARRSVTYHAEKVVLDFTSRIDDLMIARDLSRAEIGRRIGVSPAYITKVLRGNTNLTVKTMVMLAGALDARVHIQLIDERAEERDSGWHTVGDVIAHRAPIFQSLHLSAANEAEWQTLQQAA